MLGCYTTMGFNVVSEDAYMYIFHSKEKNRPKIVHMKSDYLLSIYASVSVLRSNDQSLDMLLALLQTECAKTEEESEVITSQMVCLTDVRPSSTFCLLYLHCEVSSSAFGTLYRESTVYVGIWRLWNNGNLPLHASPLLPFCDLKSSV